MVRAMFAVAREIQPAIIFIGGHLFLLFFYQLT